MPICQIIFEEVHGIPEGPYAGQFAIQGPPAGGSLQDVSLLAILTPIK
jgi:hypothetical protein